MSMNSSRKSDVSAEVTPDPAHSDSNSGVTSDPSSVQSMTNHVTFDPSGVDNHVTSDPSGVDVQSIANHVTSDLDSIENRVSSDLENGTSDPTGDKNMTSDPTGDVKLVTSDPTSDKIVTSDPTSDKNATSDPTGGPNLPSDPTGDKGVWEVGQRSEPKKMSKKEKKFHLSKDDGRYAELNPINPHQAKKEFGNTLRLNPVGPSFGGVASLEEGQAVNSVPVPDEGNSHETSDKGHSE